MSRDRIYRVLRARQHPDIRSLRSPQFVGSEKLCCVELQLVKSNRSAVTETRHRASASMYSLTFRVRVMLP